MEVDERRTPDDELGPQIAAGRDATIHAVTVQGVGPDRVLRRTAADRDQLPEAQVMEHLRRADYPVPQVFRVGPGELVLERIEGPTMLADTEAHPWRVRRHARTLADLHTRLHAVPPPPGMRPYAVPGASVLHLDLHPGNVLLSPTGPVVIDWTNAHVGAAEADVAVTWIIMAAFELDESPRSGSPLHRAFVATEDAFTPWIRAWFVRAFLKASGVEQEARRVLGVCADTRLADRNVRPGEATAIRALVERERSAG